MSSPSRLAPLALTRTSSLPRVASGGALLAGIPTLALGLAATRFADPALEALWGAIATLAPEALAPFLFVALVFAAPALAALPVAALVARVARGAGKTSPEAGRALAAGAGIGASAAVCALVLAGSGSFTGLLARTPLLAAGALAVGVIGGAAFQSLPHGSRRRQVPDLYRSCAVAGWAGPALLLGGGLWTLAASWFPMLSPEHLTRLLSPAFAETATLGLGLGCLAPVTWLLARTMSPRSPGESATPIRVGLMLPVLLPLVTLAGALAIDGLALSRYLGMLAGCLLGAIPHGLAAYLGSGGSGRPRRLPAASPG